jgi:hypothetical protein
VSEGRFVDSEEVPERFGCFAHSLLKTLFSTNVPNFSADILHEKL